MNEVPKLLLTIGAFLIVVGLLWHFGGRFLSLGKWPGDILIKKENTTFYFPIMTSIVLSIVISVILFIIGRFR